ncbi:hypothetical protein COO72_06060 [Bifidobacterium callitrichos]|nr:hypothetical protein COO72_06060 [Bifidobacterium callitrichos]
MAKQPVEVSIRGWKKNTVKPGREHGRVLLMPGTGYNCDRPLLYWSAQALVEGGWRIDRMNVAHASDDLSSVIPVINSAIDGWVSSVRAETPDARLLLIGKSLTTMTYPHVATHYGLPFVLLTPVLHHADFDPSARVIPVPRVGDDIVAESEAPSVAVAKALLHGDSGDAGNAGDAAVSADELARWRDSRYPGPAPLVCAGTADPFYDRARANALTPHVHEYPDANHSIEVPGHWRRSLDYLKEVSASVAQYAATL